MLKYRISGLANETAEEVRTTLRSPQYGHPAHVETATGYGPCRVCLHTFEEGRDERILFTYQPFQDPERYLLPARCSSTGDSAPAYDDLDFPAELRACPWRWTVMAKEGCWSRVIGWANCWWTMWCDVSCRIPRSSTSTCGTPKRVASSPALTRCSRATERRESSASVDIIGVTVAYLAEVDPYATAWGLGLLDRVPWIVSSEARDDEAEHPRVKHVQLQAHA